MFVFPVLLSLLFAFKFFFLLFSVHFLFFIFKFLFEKRGFYFPTFKLRAQRFFIFYFFVLSLVIS